ncbi:MAG: glutaredoxin family protein [Gammaproteobacteria bacterium]|nr:glutaredoxin family protein [Gammaproteobacteria bacterium]MBT8109917.1 glutaredoxin family protein [Gammaproteobacteria bacterium]NND47547.1 glutaredoxin family protein [Woeseiaceae bacterium]NNL44619.1 glutaredoxin family protein [Woeseiaceae bacterium]
MPALQVYSRQGCHLCDLLVEELLGLVGNTLVVEVRDIDSRPDWQTKYDVRVPVVEYEDRLISEYPLDRGAVSRLIKALPAAASE